MSLKYFFPIIFFICAYLLTLLTLAAQETEDEIIIISERVGKEIDLEENNKFKLFEGIKGFQSAVYIKLLDGRYFLKITYLDENTGELKIYRIQQSEESMNSIRYSIDHFREKQAHQDTVYQEPGIALFWEVCGKPFGSLNLGIRIKKSSSVSLGIVHYYLFSQYEVDSRFSGWSEYEEGKNNDVSELMPNIMYYYLRGEKNHRFEIGGGFSVRPVWNKDIDGDFPLAFHGVIGYRYQKRRGFLFRVGLTPSYWPDAGFSPWPWMGISFGCSL